MRATLCGLSIALLAGVSQASAQSRPVPFPSMEIATQWQAPATAGTRVPNPALDESKKSDHTATGFLIGAGIGLAAGWMFYNAMCEAVDNQCTGSRMPTVMIGGVIGAGLGGLIGSLAD
jgi:hypothetical protein